MDIYVSLTWLLAFTYGLYFIGVGFALMLNPSRFRKWYEAILSESHHQMMGGTFALLIGSFLLATQVMPIIVYGTTMTELMGSDYIILRINSYILTLIGLWGVITGIGCLLSDKFIQLFRPMVNSQDYVYRLSGFFWFLLGVFLVSFQSLLSLA